MTIYENGSYVIKFHSVGDDYVYGILDELQLVYETLREATYQ